MSAGEYVAGVALLAIVAVSAGIAGRALRARFLPGWTGAPARLAELTAALSLVVVTAELLGAVGALQRGWLAAACTTLALASKRHRLKGTVPLSGGDSDPRGQTPLSPVGLLGVGLVLFEWGARSVEVLGRGMADPDTLWYHMPFAARFAQEGWTTRLHFTEQEPITTFHPATAELLHGLGISLFGGFDVLSPFISLGFALLALLAGWCIGRPYGAAAASLLGVAIVLVTPIVLQTQPGEASNDVVGVAFLLCAVALLVNGGLRGAPLAFAGAAAGLAVGTKLSLLAPAGALTLGVIAIAPRGERLRLGGLWLGPLLVTGSFWFVRNLFRVGNPLPWLDFGPLPSPSTPQTDELSYSVAHYLTDGDIWRDVFRPGLNDSLGDLWPAILLLVLAAGALALVRPADRIQRMLGAVALVAGAAYIVTPAGAAGPEGSPLLFGLNLRFAMPALALGLALLPTLPLVPRRIALAVLAAVLLLTQADTGFRPPDAAFEGALLALVALAAWALVHASARLPRPAAALAMAAVALALAAAGRPVSESYLDERYAERGPTLPGPSLWARDLEHARIGISGYLLHYPLYGLDTSNEVAYVGRREEHGGFTRIESCREWRAALDAGGYDYVVTAPVGTVVIGPREATRATSRPPEAEWTASAPAARPVLEEGDGALAVFRLEGPLDDTGCDRPLATVPPRDP